MGKKSEKLHPGGLILFDSLQHTPIGKIYFNLVDENHWLADEELWARANITACLKSRENTIEQYCEKYRIYSKLVYTTEESQCKRTTCFAVVKKLMERLYSVTVTNDFIENTDAKFGVLMDICPSENSARKYIGKIKKIENTTIFFDFLDNEIPSSTACLVSVIAPMFNFQSWNRTIDLISSGDQLAADLIFPTISSLETSIANYVLKEKMLMQSISFTRGTYNSWQKRAVAGILLRDTPHIPYILFGPPGTGKTTTLVEATIQLVRAKETNRILVCTPSNTAADHFTMSLLRNGALDRSFIFRVYSTTQLPGDKPEEILPVTCQVYSPVHGRHVFGIPPAAEFLSKHRVFVVTLSCSTYFVSARLKGAFSHIIVDEAGQAHEIETMVPFCGLGDVNTRFVLAGDPKQLGPVDTVKLTKNLSFDRSMMERLLSIKFYSDRDCRFMCMLRDNYRAHKSLVDFPSKMFYDSQLVAAVPLSERNSLSQWSELPNRGFPMFWHCVKGNQVQEPKGTSLKNCIEAELVVRYVKQLICVGVTPNEIGVISPYKYQVKLIQEKLATLSKDLTVDSVEKYQGSERRAIIVSTVRTKGIGFLNCRKRLNTTITRAKELLIIIGDHENLTTNKVWRQFFEHCYENDAIKYAKSREHLENYMEKLSMKNSSSSENNSYMHQSAFEETLSILDECNRPPIQQDASDLSVDELGDRLGSIGLGLDRETDSYDFGGEQHLYDFGW